MQYPVPPKALAHIQAANQNFLLAKAHYETLLNAVAEAMGIDTDTPGIELDLGQGVFTSPGPPKKP